MWVKGQKRLCYRASCARYPSITGRRQEQRVVPAVPGKYWSGSAAILLRTPLLWLWLCPRGKLLRSDAEPAILVARYQAIESIPALLEEDADGGAGLIA